MLVGKVQQKIAALSHHAARLEATHQVLLSLLTDDVSDEDFEASLSAVKPAAQSTGDHSAFMLQAAVCFVVGVVVESVRFSRNRAAYTELEASPAL